MGVETEGDVGRVPPVKKSAGTALQNIIFRIFFLTRITSKTPYLAIDERALGKKRSSVHLFVSVHYAVKYCIFLQGKMPTICVFIVSNEVRFSCSSLLMIGRLYLNRYAQIESA